ncbi:MAG: hypothetical protein R6X06_04695 [Gammaproteobacteria bacterium]
MSFTVSTKITTLAATVALGASLFIGTQAIAQGQGKQPVPADQQMKMMLQMYKPELREKVMALKPETRQKLLEMLSVHTNRSDKVTFRQVMQEVLLDYQGIVAGIATDNAEMAADAARRLANHRLPKGGLYPYFSLDNINDEDLMLLPGMNDAVEGTALKLAEAADRGNMAEAASHLTEIMVSCVACHQMFRGQPGVSDMLVSAK